MKCFRSRKLKGLSRNYLEGSVLYVCMYCIYACMYVLLIVYLFIVLHGCCRKKDVNELCILFPSLAATVYFCLILKWAAR